jgi:hypothetical protein
MMPIAAQGMDFADDAISMVKGADGMWYMPQGSGANLPALSAGNTLSVIGSEAAQGLLPQSSLVGRRLIPMAGGVGRALMVIPDAANGGAGS